MMIKSFWLSLVLLGVVAVSALIHSYAYNRDKVEDSLGMVAAMVHGVVPALEVACIEPDAMELLGSSVRANPVYPEMPQINRMGFVYAK